MKDYHNQRKSTPYSLILWSTVLFVEKQPLLLSDFFDSFGLVLSFGIKNLIILFYLKDY